MGYVVEQPKGRQLSLAEAVFWVGKKQLAQKLRQKAAEFEKAKDYGRAENARVIASLLEEA